MNEAAFRISAAGCAIDKITLALFDDHRAMRDTLSRTLGRDPAFDVVASGASAADAIAAGTELALDIVLLDLNMPGSGIEAAARLARDAPATKIVMLTSEDDAHAVDAALAAGASAYVVKGTPLAELRRTVREVLAGKSTISPSLAARLIRSGRLAAPWTEDAAILPFELAEREEQILRRLAQGLTAGEIGTAIGLTPQTVDAFISNIMMKVHACGPGNLPD